MVSFIELASFTFLIAGNLVSISLLLQYCFGLPKIAGIIVSGALMVRRVYTARGDRPSDGIATMHYPCT